MSSSIHPSISSETRVIDPLISSHDLEMDASYRRGPTLQQRALPFVVYVVLLIPIIILYFVYEPLLPDTLPSHYNTNGVVDKTSTKQEALNTFVGLAAGEPAGMLLLFTVIFYLIAKYLPKPLLLKRWQYSASTHAYWESQPRDILVNVASWVFLYVSFIPVVIQTGFIVGFWASFQVFVSGSTGLYGLFVIVGLEVITLCVLFYRHYRYLTSFG